MTQIFSEPEVFKKSQKKFALKKEKPLTNENLQRKWLPKIFQVRFFWSKKKLQNRL